MAILHWVIPDIGRLSRPVLHVIFEAVFHAPGCTRWRMKIQRFFGTAVPVDVTGIPNGKPETGNGKRFFRSRYIRERWQGRTRTRIIAYAVFELSIVMEIYL
jgi:hypothetical protein